MQKPVIAPFAATLVALAGLAFTASASAQQQPEAPAVQQQAHTAVAADNTQLAVRSNDGGSVRAATATKAIVPPRTEPARTPATPDSDCVGPASFCNVYYGS